MKSILLILMLSVVSLYSQVMTNGVFVPVQFTGTPTYEVVGKGIKPNNNPIVIGKTYSVGKTVYSVITTNDTVTFHFSNGLLAKIGTNSNFSVNDFQQELTIPTYPSTPKLGTHNLSLMLSEGEGAFMFNGSDSNSMCSVSTPLVDIELLKGKFYFRSSEKGVVVFVLEGSLRYHGERGRNDVVEAGKAVAAAPIQFQMRGLDDKVFLNTKKAEADELTKLLAETKPLERASKISFVVVNGDYLGVNID